MYVNSGTRKGGFADLCLSIFDFFNDVYLQVLKINPEKKDIESFVPADFTLLGYDPHQKIEMKMAV